MSLPSVEDSRTMILHELQISGYRSIRSLVFKLGRLNVVVGANGSGKTNLYRALYLTAAAADGRLSRALAEEGGMASALWAGDRTSGPVRMTLKARLEHVRYELSLGLPTPDAGSQFVLDPLVKEEKVFFHGDGRPAILLDRRNTTVHARDADGAMVSFPGELPEGESVLANLREPHRFPTLSTLRQALLSWRFYHHFRTDADSPIRQPQMGVRTPVLSHDGRDLAAALQTIVEIGDGERLVSSIAKAFAGARLEIDCDRGRFETRLQSPEFKRSFQARELSDGTLRYLCLLAALLSPRPPMLMALNEPEASLHPDLYEPLADLLVYTSERSQLWVTTHSERLADLIQSRSKVVPMLLEKLNGETRFARLTSDD